MSTASLLALITFVLTVLNFALDVVHFSRSNSGGVASLTAPVLVVAPSTLVHHWATEAKRFFTTFYSNTIVYTGTPAHRKQLAPLIQQQQSNTATTASTTTSTSQKMKGTKRSTTAATQQQDTATAPVTLVVTSYAVLQRDTTVLSSRRWRYCILDEAHLLRNPDAAAARAVVTLQCDHRLALTGTPIQNTVAELWSIFHCIMPGYLGERTDFRSRYVSAYCVQTASSYFVCACNRGDQAALPTSNTCAHDKLCSRRACCDHVEHCNLWVLCMMLLLHC
jgi:SNF2 family DNA or RNA helicase